MTHSRFEAARKWLVFWTLFIGIGAVAGATEMLLQGKGTPGELRVAVTSKGGTTAAALDVMKTHDFDGMVQELLEAACKRSIELGRS